MKVLKSWLNDYTDLNDISSEVIADKLTLSGSAVEEVISGLDDKVIVAEIVKIEPHPNADRLRLATIQTGSGEMTVVCGAPNIEVGQKIPFAQLGTVLPGNFEIKKVAIRGVESCGMLCAEDELGLGESHEGIIIFPTEYEVGKPYNQYIECDTVFDLDITSNRGDCLSHIGIARELSVLFGKPLTKKEYQSIENDPKILIDVENKEFCPRYFGCVIKGVKIGPSPEWLVKRLQSLGVNSINNVVDVTNYIMLDLGQPLHAFDLNKLDGGIIVRTAKENEDFVTLDGNVRHLPCDALVISDHSKAVALAGIMGGLNSEISNDTVDVFLESAEFDRRNIRKTAKLLNMSTDASFRYERGIDSGNLRYAMEKAANLIVEVAGGTISGQNSDICEIEAINTEIAYDRINKLLGQSLANEEINSILTSLGFGIENNSATAPTWRHDIELWQDLAEEIGRIYGYDKFAQIPLEKTDLKEKKDFFKKDYLKNLLADNGFTEVLTYAFLSEKDLEAAKLNSGNLLEVSNPIQPENKYLRSSLVPNLLKAVAKNPSFDPTLLFEVGEIFNLSEENTHLCVVTAGKNAKKAIEDAKTVVVNNFNLDSNLIIVNELSRDDLQRYKIKKPLVYYFEINLSGILPTIQIDAEKLQLAENVKTVHYRPISKYPSLTRDLAFIVDTSVNPEEITQTIYDTSDLLARVELFDEFASDKFGQNKKNVAYHLYLQKMDKTMTDQEADQIIQQIIASIGEKYQASLRIN